MRFLTPAWRSARVAEHLLTGAAIGLVVAAGRPLGLRAPWLPDVVAWWHARLCRALGLRLEVTGELAQNAVPVANHVSWLDIPVIGAQGRIRFLSKTEVKDWPLLGWLAKLCGTLFIARGANEIGAVVERIAVQSSRGELIAIFPEGTTTDGTRLQRFHARLFAAVQRSGILVQPLAIRYGANDSPDRIAPFVGDDALLPHLLRVLRHPGLQVRLHVLPAFDASALERGVVARRCRQAIAEALEIPAATPVPQVKSPARRECAGDLSPSLGPSSS